ncbi:MAG: 2-oxoacid:acceptor oxidoreductase subunit alpha [Actinobacteria bacterium]|jgi:2-oxoglutarate ferredoxin oxidoreductase subunit alpha|nr:2-oxoacid:acceptor oxidoreductase subunit alpha [Actinomycetota bacterium]
MEQWHSHLLRERVDQSSLLIQGNRACALGALDAGVTFFAGYPITPSSEIMEAMAEELPRIGGVFVQMEDEIASICACIGASLTGKLAMTATSGPGFSLMQEALGYAIIIEAPLVVVNVMRVGPSTGRPTAPSQGDVMQARWGTHGDHPAIVLAASNVADMYRLTMAAVRFAQRFRTPVTVLADQLVGQMRESFSPELVGRYRLTSGDFDFTPGYIRPELAPEVRPPHILGLDEHPHVTGLFHDETGFPTNDPDESNEFLRELYNKVAHHREELCLYDIKNEGKGRVCIVAYGSCARTARAVWRLAEYEGLPVEVLHLYTLFPLPVEIIQQVARRVEFILIPELNLGQYAHEVRKMAEQWTTVIGMGKIDGTLFTPRELLDRIAELTGKYESV